MSKLKSITDFHEMELSPTPLQKMSIALRYIPMDGNYNLEQLSNNLEIQKVAIAIVIIARSDPGERVIGRILAPTDN